MGKALNTYFIYKSCQLAELGAKYSFEYFRIIFQLNFCDLSYATWNRIKSPTSFLLCSQTEDTFYSFLEIPLKGVNCCQESALQRPTFFAH